MKYWRKTPLNEITRREILRRSKTESESSRRRYFKLQNYSSRNISIDFVELYSYDSFVARMRVGGYDVIVSFEGPFENLYQTVRGWGGVNRWKRITLKILTDCISKALDDEDLQVDCSCPDFQYRFAYWLSRPDVDAKYGMKQNTEPEVRNTGNNQGYVCKHVLAALYGKRWVIAAAKIWLNYIRTNPGLTEEAIWG